MARRQVRHARHDRLEHRHAPAQLSPPPCDVDPHAVVPGPFGRSGARPADYGQRRRLRRARTRSTTLTHNVPYSYLDELYPAITNNAAQFASDAAYDGLAEGASPFGKSIPLWQDYVAGTDPTVATNIFSANITFENGELKVTWNPDLNKDGQQRRVYTVKGAAELTDTFTAPTNSASRFFKVEVSLP